MGLNALVTADVTTPESRSTLTKTAQIQNRLCVSNTA